MKFVNSMIFVVLSLMVHSQSFAVSATWIGGNNNNDLKTAANWTSDPQVPNDLATFQSAVLGGFPNLISPVETLELNTFLFPSTMPNGSFDFTVGKVGANSNLSELVFNSLGVKLENNNQQTFNVYQNGKITFKDSSSAYTGSGLTKPIYTTNEGAVQNPAGLITFRESSVAGSAIFNNNGDLEFRDNSSAQNAIINNNNFVKFLDSSTAASSRITMRTTAQTDFDNSSTAASATLDLEDATLFFSDSSSMGSSTITAENNSLIVYSSTVTSSTANINLLTDSEFDVETPTTQISIGSLAGDDTAIVDLGGHQLQVGTSNLNTTYAGAIQSTPGSTGKFDKVGTGTFIFSGEGNYTGDTTVKNGTYVLNGLLTGSNVIVDPGATLRGTGSIVAASLTVNGTIAPGNSIGTLNVVNGPFVQGNGSSYNVEINGLGQSSLINVIGTGSTATIQTNATVNVSSPDETLLFGYNYLILHADQGVTGTYAQVNQNISQFIVPHLVYASSDDIVNNVFLNLTTNFSGFVNTRNEACVAAALDAASSGTLTSDEQAVLSALSFSSSAENLRHSLNSLTGSEYIYLTQLSEYTDYRFARRLFSSVRELIRPSCCRECNLEGWARVEYDHAKFKGNHNSKGFNDNSWDISAGAHTCICEDLVLGLAGNYSSDSVKFLHGSKTNTFQSGQGALYGVYQNCNFYVFSDLIIGETWSKNFKRHLHAGSIHRHAKSKPNIFHGKYYAEIGAELEFCNLVFEPFVGADAGWYSRKRISEHGAESLNRFVKKKTGSYWDTYVGIHLLECFCNCMNVSGDLYWQHRFGAFQNHISAGFSDFGCPTACRIDGHKLGRDGIVGTLNLSTCLCNNWEIYAEFNGQAWKHFSSYGGTLGVKYSW